MSGATRVTIGTVVLLLLEAGCLSPYERPDAQQPDGSGAAAGADMAMAPSAAYFDPDIQKDFDTLGCTNAACHGGNASPVIMPMPGTLAEWMSNYTNSRSDCSTLDCIGGGAASLLLTKPLQGSAVHAGAKPFASAADPTYQRWLAWIEAGAPFSKASSAPAPADMTTATDMGGGDALGPSETLTVTFSTSMSPSAGQSPYDPKNVVAVWIEDGAGNFVKTIGRWANTRRSKLVAWTAKAGTADVDAVSGATNANYGTLTARWNMSSRQSPAPALPTPADGTFSVRLELADSNATAPAQNNQGTFTFVRNGTSSTRAALSSGGFTNVSLTYTGR